MIVTLLATLTGFTIIILDNINRFKTDLVRSSQMDAHLIGRFAAVPISFFQPEQVGEVLNQLQGIPNVINALAYDKNFKEIAAYNKKAPLKQHFKHDSTEYYEFTDNFLHVIQPMMHENISYGTLYLKISTDELRKRIKDYVLMSCFIVFGVLVFSFFLARWLQKIISSPIVRLAGFSRKISRTTDYSLRITNNEKDEIGNLYRQFNHMLEQIEKRETARNEAEKRVIYYVNELRKNNQELEEFNYVASHDLREPLRTITTYCELLREDIGEDINSDAVEDIEFIIQAANRMNALILDLLALSRAGRVEFDKKPIDLNYCLDNVLKDLEIRILETSTNINSETLPTVLGDGIHLTRVIQNIISNAIKFHSDTPPVIIIKTKEIDDNTIEIAISDNGIGMEKKYLEQIFAPFKRLHGISKYEGTGIGLAICKKIIERHGGKIYAESERGKGSTIKFTLVKYNKN